MNRIDLGIRLKKLRIEKGWTQINLQNKTGIPQGQISRFEKGFSEIPASLIPTLAKVFGITVDQFFHGVNNGSYATTEAR